MKRTKPAIHCAVALATVICAPSAMSKCLASGVQLQILGSGGPGAAGGRASSGYVLWIDGVSRFMVDAGSGTKDQFHRAGANSDDIRFVALSHLHPDHSAELPAIFWPAGGNFQISGPTGSAEFPSIENFIDTMFGDNGAYRVLGPRLDLDLVTVDTTKVEPTAVWNADNVAVFAKGVPHGDVPTLAYKFEFGNTSIVFASDQNGSDPSFIDFTQGADYLVIHLAGAEDATGAIAQLHAKPSVWGAMAADADVEHVIVSHITAMNSQALDASLSTLLPAYSGAITVGEDLMCIDL
jgi:ribonuclease BN (tRNA processing enzyme)